MTVPVPLVVQALRARLPEVTSRRLHKLLYYVQGHHLATFGVPLISERIVAWDSGPAVGELWELDQRSRQASGDSSTTFAAAGPADGPAHSAAGALGEAELNTVGYVASWYGALSARDLEHLSRSETPWTRADVGRPTGQSSLIELSWMRDYFRSDGDEADDLTAPPLDAEVVRTWLAEAPTRRRGPALPDKLERLAARDATSVGAVAIRELAEVSRRADNPAVLGVLPDLNIDVATIVEDLDDERGNR